MSIFGFYADYQTYTQTGAVFALFRGDFKGVWSPFKIFLYLCIFKWRGFMPANPLNMKLK